MAICLKPGDHDYCIVDPIRNKQKGRLEIQAKTKLQRMGTSQQHILSNNSDTRNAKHGLFCVANNEKTRELHEFQPGSMVQGNKCSLPKLDPSVLIHFSTLLPNRKGFREDKKTGSQTRYIDSSSMARSTVVPFSIKNDNSPPTTSSKLRKSSSELPRGTTPNDSIKKSNTEGISCLKQQLETKGISESAINIMLHSKRESTTHTYTPCWQKWVLWCQRKQVDPTIAPVNEILDFLASLFQEGFEYRTLGVYRSAISAYHKHHQGKPICQHPDICSFMAGVDNLRPPQPRYCTMWEVEGVLTHLRNMECDKNLPDKDLTFKTVMLLALTAAKRASELHLLDTKFMAVGETKIVFQLRQKPKQCKTRGKKQIL